MTARRWVYAVLTAYTLGFLLFPPRVLLVIDEFQYVGQALAFARGSLNLPEADPVIPESHLRAVSNFPPGTSLLQAPLVAIAGWRGAMALSLLSVLAATLITMRWLRETEHDERFALLVPAFLGVAFFGRLAMSDVPSAAIVALSLWLIWRAGGQELKADEKADLEADLNADPTWSFFAGLAAGLSILFRETNAVLLGPILLGAVLRKKCVPWALVLGGVLGVAVRLAISYEMFGNTFYLRDSGYGFSLLSLRHTLPQYAVILLAMFPLGALLPFFYRGPRRAEIVTAVALYVALFLFYEYDSARENGAFKGLILTSRFMIPAVPLLTFMAADVYPRWLARAPTPLQAHYGALRTMLFVAVAAMALAIHPALRRQENATLAIVDAIHTRTTQSQPIITNHHATLKYLSPVYGPRRLILRSFMSPADLPRLNQRYGKLDIVFLDRTDSPMFRQDAANNDAFLAAAASLCAIEPVHEAQYGLSTRLREFEVVSCK